MNDNKAAARNPIEAVDALVAEREQVARAKSAAIARFNEHEIALDRSLSAMAFLAGRVGEAEAALKRILALLPDDLDALNRLGHIAQFRGEPDEAKRLYSRVGELAPDDAWRAISLGNLGLIEEARGNLDAAEDYLKRSLAIEETRLGAAEKRQEQP